MAKKPKLPTPYPVPTPEPITISPETPIIIKIDLKTLISIILFLIGTIGGAYWKINNSINDIDVKVTRINEKMKMDSVKNSSHEITLSRIVLQNSEDSVINVVKSVKNQTPPPLNHKNK